MGAESYEKLGAFYLGREYDPKSGETSDAPLLYDARDLTTHAVCVGMTGSGKTGLCVSLLEEAGIDGIPSIVIDPKGDIGNLLLTFPELRGEDFQPWVDAGEAERKGKSVEEYAQDRADLWRNGLADWGQDGERIRRFRESVDLTIYTPGSNAGVPITPLKSFDAPAQAVLDDAEALRERVSSAASGLLALVGIEADPIRSREHILISTILDDAWRAGRSVELAELIGRIQNPPFDRVGVVDVETFMKEKDRAALAMSVNNLLASPSFAGWLEGEALDVGRLLHTKEGKPRISILSIAHLSEPERMFFVTLLLNEVVAWMRAQPGTPSLRAILYMDEVFGYFPPVANPPSKTPMLTLMKQARAFGVGCVLATQNPVDLDYKGLTNAGTWLLGRLQTERDKERVLEGLEGASGKGLDRRAMDKLLAGLGSRVFLMNNVHDDGPVVFRTRWAMSYLRGPLTRGQIQKLMEEKKRAAEAQSPAAEAGPPAPSTQPAPATEETHASSAPAGAPGVPVGFAPVVRPFEGSLVYRPGLVCRASLHFVRVAAKVDAWRDLTLVAPFSDDEIEWEEAYRKEREPELDDDPDPRGGFGDLPTDAMQKRSYSSWRKAFIAHVYRHEARTLWYSKKFKAWSELGDDEGAFRAKIRQLAREHRDEEVEKLRKKYSSKLATLEERVRRAEQRVEEEKSQARQSGVQTAVSFGTTLLGALFGRKLKSATNASRAGSTLSRASKTAKHRGEISRAEDTLEAHKQRLADLEAEFEGELGRVREEEDPSSVELEAVTLRPRKTDMGACEVGLVWLPYELDQGRLRVLFE